MLNKIGKQFILLLSLLFIYENVISQTENNIDVQDIFNKGLRYLEKEEFLRANKDFQIAAKILEKEVSTIDTSFADCLSYLAYSYLMLGNKSLALKEYLKAFNIYEKNGGAEHKNYDGVVSNIARIYYDTHQFKNSEIFYLKRLEGFDKNNIHEEEYVMTLLNLIDIFKTIPDKQQLEKYLRELISVYPQSDRINYFLHLYNLANTCLENNNIEDAELYFNRASVFNDSNFIAKEHLMNEWGIKMGLSDLKFQQEKYSEAEKLFFEYLELTELSFGKESAEYAGGIYNFANLYFRIGLYDKAEKFCLQALALQKKVNGINSVEYSQSLLTLASIKKNINGNKWQEIEKYNKDAIKILKKTEGGRGQNYINALQNLANIYSYLNKYVQAISLYKEVIKIRKLELGILHPEYAKALVNLGSNYIQSGNTSEGLRLYLEALGIYEKKYKVGSSSLTWINNLISGVYEEKGDNIQAMRFNLKAFQSYLEGFRLNTLFLSENEKYKYIINQNFYRDEFYSFLYRYSNDDTRFIELSFNSEIKENGFVFNSSKKFKNVTVNYLASDEVDTSLSKKWGQYKLLHLQISQLYQLPLAQQNNLKELEEQAEILEKELMRKLPAFQEAVLNNNITWKDVQTKLKANEAAIDFVSFRYFDKRWTDTILYAAFVLRPGWDKPKFVSLFREDQLLEILGNENNKSAINAIYEPANNVDTTQLNSLYKLIWQPMDSLLTGVSKVYISPSGLLHRISFSAIPIPEGGRMMNRYEIQTMSNIRILAEQHSTDTTVKSFSLFGDIDYDKEPAATVGSSNLEFTSTDTTSVFTAIRSLRSGKWDALSASANEVAAIQNIATSLKMPAIVYTKQNASEENFKRIGNDKSPVPSILHIATHGFAFATPLEKQKDDRLIFEEKKVVFQKSEDPLTRAGLVLAGGNEAWTKGKPYPDHEDGILTAREVSDVDLRGCVLATLSACETGLGDIKGSEGVFGLQRAFKMAGVKYLIVSLWRVPDAETSNFMESFYSNWLIQKMPIKEAFRQTQITMSIKYKKPYQWAAFVLVE